MFSCCFRQQNTDDDEYRQRPKTRNNLLDLNSQITARTVAIRPNDGSEAVKSLKQLQNECLAAHNKYRAKHGASPLTLNKQMCLYATEWAKVSRTEGCTKCYKGQRKSFYYFEFNVVVIMLLFSYLTSNDDLKFEGIFIKY